MAKKKAIKPAAKDIDALIFKFGVLDAVATGIAARAKNARADADVVKAEVIALVDAWGVKHAEKSKRLEGDHNQATVTRGTRTDSVPEKIEELKAHLDKSKIPQLKERFFQEHTTYSLVAGPGEVLKTLDLKKKFREKLTAMLAACFKIETNNPSLKVVVVPAEKP